MMSEWKECTWGDLITLEYGKPVKDKESVDGTIPVFGTNGQIGTSHLPPLCKVPSFTVGRNGAYRGVHFSSVPFSVIDTAFYAMPITDCFDIKWAYYMFLTYDINRMDSGSAIPSTDRYELYRIPVMLPTIEIQKRVVSILDTITNKITLNTAINENLEQQAQALFKAWFVDFEPFGGVMPADWNISNLLGIAEYLNGLAMQKYRPAENEVGIPVLKIKELRQGVCDCNSELCSPTIKEDYIIQDGDVIFSWSGSLLVDFWCGGTCGLNQHLFKVSSQKYDKWFYYLWTKYHLNRFIAIAADKATTMGHIKREDLAKAEVYIPNQEQYNEFGAVMQPILNLIIENRIENRRLAALRDTLLPKLMNGEIDVSEVKI